MASSANVPPADAEWLRVDLPTWSRNGGAKSANEVAQII